MVAQSIQEKAWETGGDNKKEDMGLEMWINGKAPACVFRPQVQSLAPPKKKKGITLCKMWTK
jgi:hypothetical protein